MTVGTRPGVRELLLARRGVVFLSSHAEPSSEVASLARGVELELAALAHAPSARLSARLAQCTQDELVAFRAWALDALLTYSGGKRKHVPLFRRFPRDVPADTGELWWSKVLVHFVQAEGQACLFCGRVGTTHVLDPCRHVVCDRCFDGTSYSACPSCERHVDRSSPFFQPGPERGKPVERVTFRRLELGDDVEQEARALFTSLCARKQALSPSDREALVAILEEHKTAVLAWLPDAIPVRENVAIVFGTLFAACCPDEVLPHAKRFMTTATDVLRFIAVLSGTDGSLQRQTIHKLVRQGEEPSEFWRQLARLFRARTPMARMRDVYVPLEVHRFKVAKLSRPLRRSLLAVLEALTFERLVEDMLRHREYWVWVGEFLHPHEHAKRCPNVARAFQIVRKRAPDGAVAPAFESWNARVERAVRDGDSDGLLAVLGERPGEFARRFDLALRLAQDEPGRARVVSAFANKVRVLATPVLLTLRNHLPARERRAGVRVYWPKGTVTTGYRAPDRRPALSRTTIDAALRTIDGELLRRFGTLQGFDSCVLDEALSTVMVPFNERTASRSAVSLPRGSTIAVPPGKVARLFLHWCEPQNQRESETDIDLSVGFYDASWRHVGVCSYYELQLAAKDGALIAQSSGDLRDAPWPDGASEFIDVHRDAARAAGARYAVMVVTAYAGLPFSMLERGFAGLMLRDDVEGEHFDPRTVALRFALAGDHGVYTPLVLDLEQDELHWLDIYTQGQLQMNNVANANMAISKVCPALIAYFGSGVRSSMLDLGLLHAAARCRRVLLRGDGAVREFVRRSDEDAASFHGRLVGRAADEPRSRLPQGDGPPLFALLLHGDLELPAGSSVYALFRERVTPTLAASDLLS